MSQLTHDGYQYVLREMTRDVSAFGFKWKKFEKVWTTRDPVAASRLVQFADENVEQLLQRSLIRRVNNDLVLLPPPPGLKLLPHQETAIQFSLTRNKSYLRLAPGLGKTICAARITDILQKPVVYICPAFLITNVEEEFAKWAPNTRINVIPDSRLSQYDWWEGVFEPGSVLVVDEAHRFTNFDSQRTAVLFGHKEHKGIIGDFSHQVYMSGTPMPNRPMELYPILSKVAPQTIHGMTNFEYGNKFCGGKRTRFGWDFTGESNMQELAKRVIHPTGPFMLKMDKDLLNLPPKTEEAFVVSGSMSPKLRQLDFDLAKKYKSIDDLIRERVSIVNGQDSQDVAVATYRRWLGMEKVPLIIPYIDSVVGDEGQPMLLFAYHREVVAELVDRLAYLNPFVITGDTPIPNRHTIVREFQNSTKRHLLIGNYLSMGVGFNITRPKRVFFAEYDWTPAVNDQAADRTHRIGQTDSVHVQYAVYRNSLDKRILERIFVKRRSTTQV